MLKWINIGKYDTYLSRSNEFNVIDGEDAFLENNSKQSFENIN